MHTRLLAICCLCVASCLNLYCHKTKTGFSRIPRPSASSISQQTLSEYIRGTIRVSAQNTPENVKAREELFQRRPELGVLWGDAVAGSIDLGRLQVLAHALTVEKLYADAFSLYQRIRVIEGPSVEVEVALARIWDAWRDHVEAQQHAERAVRLDPSSAVALDTLARIFLHKSEVSRARSTFSRALLLAPDDPLLLGNIGYCYLLEGEWAKARVYLERSVSIDDSIVETRNNLGVALANLQDPVGALGHFAATGGPPAAHNNLGVVYLGNGQWEAAADEFRSALAIDPLYERAQVNLSEATRHLPAATMYTIKEFPVAARQEVGLIHEGGFEYHPLSKLGLDEYSDQVLAASILEAKRRVIEEPQVEVGFAGAVPLARLGGGHSPMLVTVPGFEVEPEKAERESSAMCPVIETADVKDKGFWRRVRVGGFRAFRKAIEFAGEVVSPGLITDYWGLDKTAAPVAADEAAATTPIL